MIFAEEISSFVTQNECAALADLARDKRVLEIGSEFGRSTVALASTASFVCSVDWHRGDEHAGWHDSLSTFWTNLERYRVRDRVVLLIAEDQVVLPLLKENLFDLAFIDAFHSYEAVRRDIALVRPALKSGGTWAFHDYGRFGVTQAVDELLVQEGGRLELQESLAWIARR